VLSGEEDPLVFEQRMLERTRRRGPSDHERHHHVGKNDNVPERDDRECFVDFQPMDSYGGGWAGWGGGQVDSCLTYLPYQTYRAYPAFSMSAIGLSLAITTSRVMVTSRTFFCVGT
jgi:hypothetical protein